MVEIDYKELSQCQLELILSAVRTELEQRASQQRSDWNSMVVRGINEYCEKYGDFIEIFSRGVKCGEFCELSNFDTVGEIHIN